MAQLVIIKNAFEPWNGRVVKNVPAGTKFSDIIIDNNLISIELEVYNVLTEYHFNVFADGVLTSSRFNNIYPIKDYKFIKDDRALVPYDEFDGIPYDWYENFRLSEQPVDINRDGADAIGQTVAEHIKVCMGNNKRPVEIPPAKINSILC